MNCDTCTKVLHPFQILRRFDFSKYIIFNYVSRKAKMSYNLKQRDKDLSYRQSGKATDKRQGTIITTIITNGISGFFFFLIMRATMFNGSEFCQLCGIIKL